MIVRPDTAEYSHADAARASRDAGTDTSIADVVSLGSSSWPRPATGDEARL